MASHGCEDPARPKNDSCEGPNTMYMMDELWPNEEDAHDHGLLIMQEVADWLQSLECNNFWAPGAKRRWQNLPSANHLVERLKFFDAHTISRSLEPAVFDTLVTVVELQLLASCSTALPPSSAENLPLYQQRTEYLWVSALRSHTQYRFAPAAGHHARACSESAPWPGLCALPARRNTSSKRHKTKRQAARSSESIPVFSGSGWTDGPSPERMHKDSTQKQDHGHNHTPSGSCAVESPSSETVSPTHERNVRWDVASSSTSEDEPKFLSWIMCQPSIPKSPKHKHNSRSQKRLKKKVALQEQPGIHLYKPLTRRIHSSRLQHLTSQAVQRIPSSLRLRRTQSAPRNPAEKPCHDAQADCPRRRSSNPSIGSPLSYSYEVPEIRRISATHASSNGSLRSPTTTTTTRGERPHPHDHLFGEASRHEIDLWQSKALFPPLHTANTPPPSLRSSPQSSLRSPSVALKSPPSSIKTPPSFHEARRATLPSSYSQHVYPYPYPDTTHTPPSTSHAHPPPAAAHGINRTSACVYTTRRSLSSLADDADADADADNTNADANADADADSSSDSEMERSRKRKSILMQVGSVEGSAMTDMFGHSSGESVVR